MAEFPSEFILLGRATVMIRGIANRLGIPWGLAERWAAAAQVALDATGPGELLPIWSIVRPTVATTADPASAAAQLRTGGANSPVLSDIWRALAVFSRTLQVFYF